MKMKAHTIEITVCADDFEQAMQRPPKDQAEFDDGARYVEKGLPNRHMDWNNLFRCACAAMPEED